MLAFAAAVLVVGSVALAQSGGPYSLEWQTIDGGGGSLSGGSYSLSGTIGQADAGALMTGGNYTLQGGFWLGAGPTVKIYIPVVLR